MIQPRLIWELARKDLLLFAVDRRGVVLCFGVPILLAIVFGAVFYRADNVDHLRPRIHLVLQKDSADLRALADRFLKNERLNVSLCDDDEAKRRLANESGSVIVILPAELQNLSFHKGTTPATNKPTIQLLHHPRGAWEARWVEGVVTELVMRHLATNLLAPLNVLPKDGQFESPFAVVRRAEHAGGAMSVHAYSHSFCGMTLQYLLFWGMDCGLLLLRERRQGIWRRLRAAPVTLLTLLTGKALATALIALAQIICTFTVGVLFFGVTIGSPVGFALVAISAAGLSAATGLLVAAIGGSEARARNVAILVILTLSLLGGLWLPTFLLPLWVQQLSPLLPTTWAARGLEGASWQGMSLQESGQCALVLWSYSTIFLLVAWWRLVQCEQATLHAGGARIEGAKS
jgi:ABC-2 type transport system permease protein